MKKGFTLVELLAVVIILALILAIAMPAIISIIDSGKSSAYKVDEGLLVKASKLYMGIDNSKLPTVVGSNAYVSLQDLKNANLITDIKDVTDQTTSCNGYVVVTMISIGNYSYTPYLECGNNYKTANYDLRTGLMAWYQFDTGVEDSSGNNRKGTLVGSPVPTLAAGKVGQSYQFTNSSQVITIPHDSAISSDIFGLDNTFTLMAWVYPTSWVNWSSVVNKAFDGFWSNSTSGLWACTENGFAAVIASNVSSNPASSSIILSYKPPLNNWYHVIARADGTYLSLWVNGNLISKALISGVTATRSENTSSITIGKRNVGDAVSFLGKIDEVRMYGRSLTDDEIIYYYNFTK